MNFKVTITKEVVEKTLMCGIDQNEALKEKLKNGKEYLSIKSPSLSVFL